MPFNVREVDKLQQWLLDRYAASAINVCIHQPLPKMSGPKLKLIVDPTVTPVAKHVPAPVLWHFREKVKAGLETVGWVCSWRCLQTPRWNGCQG